MRGVQVIVLREIVGEVGREFLRAENVQMLGVGEIIERVEADGVHLRVEVRKIIPVLVHDCLQLGKHGVIVFNDGAVREAGKEHVFDSLCPGCLAEGAQALLVEIVERLLTHGDLIRLREEHGDGQKRLGVRITRVARLLLQGQRIADEVRLSPVVVVFEQRYIVRQALALHALVDGLHLAA